MLTLKLQRVGKKHQGSFRLIVGEKRHKLQGKQAEDLGWYSPRDNKSGLNAERVSYWLKQGVQVTDSVHNLLVGAGLLQGKKIAVHKQPKAKEGAAAAPASAEASAGEPAAAPATPASA